MKKLLVLFFVVLLLAAVFGNTFAQSDEEAVVEEDQLFENPVYTEHFIEQQNSLLDNLDTLFPRLLVNRTFDGTYSDYKQKDGYTFSSEYRNGWEELTVTAQKISNTQEYSLGWDLFNTTGTYSNFYFSVDIKLIEQDDSNKGFVFFQYTNVDIVGESKRSTGDLVYPFSVEKYITKAAGREYTTYYDLTQLGLEHDYDAHTLEMIRLDGYTSVYVDHQFIVGFEDGLDGRFSHLYGVGLKPGGEYVTFAFDNFIIRRQ